MASVNKVILLGNCGKDPEVRYMANGKAVTALSIATTSKRKDKNSGETIEDTQWHRVQFFERLADVVGEYVKKGSPIYVEGRLKYGKYTDKDGIERNTCDIIATEMQLLSKMHGQADASAPRQSNKPPAPQRTPAPAPRGGSGFDDMDDDIPFRDPLAYRGVHLVI